MISMNIFPRIHSIFTIMVLAMSLAACGGSSGDSGGGVTPTGFTQPDQGLGGDVFSVALATDGSGDVYVGGFFTSYNGTSSNRLIRLNSDGTVDTAFAVGTGFDSVVYNIAPALDGSGDIYVGGYFTSYDGTASNRLIRLNSDGTVDAGFAVGTGFNSDVISIAPALDGSGDVYVGGWFTSYNGTASNRLVRLNSDGTVDTAFAVGTGFNSQVTSIAPAPDTSGDVYVGGNFTTYNGTVSNGLVRLNSDGTVDTAFAMGTGFDSMVASLAPAPDTSGDIYVGGYFVNYNGTASNYLIRLNSDGTVDTGFAMGTGFDAGVFSIAPAPGTSGDIYVGGYFASYNGTTSAALIRLASSGTVSKAYSVNTGFSDEVRSLALADDGSGDVYAGGYFTSYNGTNSNYLIRLNSDGTVDTAFAVGTGFDSGVGSLALAPDTSGDVYVGGYFTSYNGTSSNRLIRLNSDGTADTAFAVGTGFDDMVNSLAPALDGSGDVYVGGRFTSYNGTASNRLVRLNSDGTVDTAFAVGTGLDNSVTSIAPALDGSGDVYVGGYFTSYNGAASNRLIRLNSDGTADTAFAMGTGFSGTVTSLALAPDTSGDVYVGGRFTSYNGTGSAALIRLNSDGTVDSAFAVGTGLDNEVTSIAPALDGSGDVYLGGLFNSYNGTASNGTIRLNSNGTVDTAFAVGNGFVIGEGGVNCLVPATDGSGNIYVGGYFFSYQDTTAWHIISLKPDGSIN